MRALKTTVAGIALAACLGSSAFASCEIKGGVINAALTTNPSTLDPMLSTTNASRQISIYLFESLVTLDENYKVIPQLAERFERSDDGLTYTFHLRKDVPFHNGDILNADDVTASLKRFFAQSPDAGRFANVVSIEAIDPLTVKVTLNKDYPFMGNLAMPSPVAAILPKKIVEAAGKNEIRGDNLIGTGPYKLTSWRPDVAVEMARFDRYPTDSRYDGPTGFGGARTACVDTVKFLPVTEEASRVAGLKTGDFDYAEAVSITAVPELEADPAVKVVIVKPRWAIVLELDHRNPMMKKLAFRKALALAINPKQALMAATFGRADYSRAQPSIFFPEQTGFYTEAGAEMYDRQNRAKVKELLAEAGYKGEPVIYLTNQNYGWMFRASQAIAAQWREAGINVKTELMDWPSQIKKAQTESDWFVNQTGWSPRFDPFQVSTSYGCSATLAFGYCNSEMTELDKIIQSGASPAERKAAWEKIQKKIWEDVVAIRIGDYFEPEATRSRLKGYKAFYTTPRFWDVSKAAK